MMGKIQIQTVKKAFPMIYAYATPQIREHDGWTKIGYTEKQEVAVRIKQQTHTSDIQTVEVWRGNAIFDDGSGDKFTDKDFHAYLRGQGIENKHNTEWFKVNGPKGHEMFISFRTNRGGCPKDALIPYTLRAEQAEAVRVTKEYYENNEEGEFLWNAKPRFGKTLSVYDFCKQIHATKILIVTNRPAIANSWYEDYKKFIGYESGFVFVSEADSLRAVPGVVNRQEYIDKFATKSTTKGFIEFLSLQDLKGSLYFGGKFDKLGFIKDIDWDVLIIDEAHEGVDTLKTDAAFDHINRRFTLHLSGTPFKALANDKFEDNAIFNWTYADEQNAKKNWQDEDGSNPYATLPRLSLFTYQMSEIVKNEIQQGIDLDGETEEFAFDLNEFFQTKNGAFVHAESVDRFLDAMTTQEKFPFSTEELRNELKHTFWLLDRVESAKALAKKLNEHPVFKDYAIILAAGDGRLDETDETAKSYDRVKAAIEKYEKTITLSVGQLTTGVTIPEWTAVLMLCNLKSPALYMQAAFRAQNPCMFRKGSDYYRKENAYVFDFDPARTLIIFEAFANDLSSDTMGGRGDTENRKQNLKELLNFFPVIGEDEEGEMIELNAEQVLTIPRKLKSKEVVRRGFMCNYLFQNISGIFSAPPEVIDIISKFTPVAEPNPKPIAVIPGTVEKLSINTNTGEVEITDKVAIGKSSALFGEKIYGVKQEEALRNETADIIKNKGQDESCSENNIAERLSKFSKTRGSNVISQIVEQVVNEYKNAVRCSDKTKLKRSLEHQLEYQTNKVLNNYRIDEQVAISNRIKALQERNRTGKTTTEIEKEFEAKIQANRAKLSVEIAATINDFAKDAAKEAIRSVEKKVKEKVKNGIEDSVRDHLRGFSRTIPSFLMAYGDDNTTLGTFDKIVPNPVFQEVTSITLDQFRFLRDGGEYVDETSGEQRQFGGKLFNPIVFDDSVKEFLQLKRKLSDYFDEKTSEDIFDYIPPQRNNQIFTPKKIVKDMVNMLEAENPGCFDDPSKTFIDFYMKSGLYISEIVKRLYRSKRMQELFPDSKTRLRHIFEKQVYGLAPTEIIYGIAVSYVLGFDETRDIKKHNFKKLDATPYARDGTLQEKLNELFGEDDKA